MTYLAGATAEGVAEVSVELNSNGSGRQRPFRLSYNINGSTIIQGGAYTKSVWEGRFLCDTKEEVDALEILYKGRELYFQDDTPSGSGEPVLVLWVGEFSVEWGDPGPEPSEISITFTLLEI